MNRILFLSAIFILVSCGSGKKANREERKLVREDINVAYIKIPSSDSTRAYPLSYDEITTICKEWNGAQYAGIYKYITSYSVQIIMNSGERKSLRTKADLVKMEGDKTYRFSSPSYFSSLYAAKEKEAIGRIQNVFIQYADQSDGTDTDQHKLELLKSFGQIGPIQDSSHLQVLLNVWMYYDPTDFPTRPQIESIFKLNKEQTLKAIEFRKKNKRQDEQEGVAPLAELNALSRKLMKP